LLEWFLNQPKGSKVMGYLNHFWNGVTTLHFAKVCLGVIRGNVVVPQLAHLIPADVLSKGALLQAFGTTYGRQDIAIEMCAVPLALDRSLATVDPEYNSKLWRAAGYPEPPSLALMIDELAEFCRIMGD
jgi:dTDP-4-dehydrorhamnose reductase